MCLAPLNVVMIGGTQKVEIRVSCRGFVASWSVAPVRAPAKQSIGNQNTSASCVLPMPDFSGVLPASQDVEVRASRFGLGKVPKCERTSPFYREHNFQVSQTSSFSLSNPTVINVSLRFF